MSKPRQAFKPDNALIQAYKTLDAATSVPSEMIAATQLILRTYRRTMRALTRELSAAPHGEFADLLRSNIKELSAKIATLELALRLHKNRLKSQQRQSTMMQEVLDIMKANLPHFAAGKQRDREQRQYDKLLRDAKAAGLVEKESAGA